MPISIHCATEYKPIWTGYIYSLRHPTNGDIFYVGKTKNKKTRYVAHLGDARNPTSEKGKYIKDILDANLKPIISTIEEIKLRTPYDNYYYDYKEFYWIKKYLEYGWCLKNVRITDVPYSESCFKKIIDTAKNGGELSCDDFYFDTDKKGFPIYDLKKIKSLGYSFSKNQFASHWSYLINLEKYERITETHLHYCYNDIPCEENKNFEHYD